MKWSFRRLLSELSFSIVSLLLPQYVRHLMTSYIWRSNPFFFLTVVVNNRTHPLALTRISLLPLSLFQLLIASLTHHNWCGCGLLTSERMFKNIVKFFEVFFLFVFFATHLLVILFYCNLEKKFSEISSF